VKPKGTCKGAKFGERGRPWRIVFFETCDGSRPSSSLHVDDRLGSLLSKMEALVHECLRKLVELWETT
jgi:hypothetical protein